MAFLALDGVDKRFPNGVLALRDLRLHVARGELLALLGPSGCGKSTVLRLLAGLDTPSAGGVRVGESGTRPRISYVFQDATLMPWATVFDNIWLPLRIAGQSRTQAAARIDALIGTLGLAGFEQAYPSELSGGMKMRVSIARALATDPEVLLMDEPFAALDEITRQRLNEDLLALWQQLHFTLVFVTHSVAEAVFLAQRVVVMAPRPGRVVAQVPVNQPYPRNAGFRLEPAYLAACREALIALESTFPASVADAA